MSSTDAAPDRTSRLKAKSGDAEDKVFSGLALAAGVTILLVLAFVAIFLVIESLPALSPTLFSDQDGIDSADSFWDYVWPLMAGTVMASAFALLMATPVAIGIALYISHYAPRRIATPVGYVIDLLAAIPLSGLRGLGNDLPRPADGAHLPVAEHLFRVDPAVRRS